MAYKNLSTAQNNLIDTIDNKLDLLLNTLEYSDYVDFLRSDDYLSTYDDVLGYNDVDYLPDAFLSGLTVEFLEKVLNRVLSKLNDLE